jgi:di/tricarboxylate transporter
MTFEIGFLFLLLVLMVVLFLTEKIPVDLTAFTGLVILVLTGYLTADQAFTGFASSAVITMLGVFILGAALLQTGLADIVANQVHKWVGGREIVLVVTMMLVAGLLSCFMNNIAATAVLMPAVASICKRTRIAPSRLFMPLAFGAILGGTMTLVGTPPNILVAAILEQEELEPFRLFDFSPVGAVLLGVGIIFMVTIGRKLLPVHEVGPALTESQALAEVYQLHDRLFSIRIPPSSGLDGVNLHEAQLGRTLGIQVVAITRNAETKPAPTPETVLQGGDLLLAEGNLADLNELLRVQGIKVRKASPEELPPPIAGVSGMRAVLSSDSPLLGQSLRNLDFRGRFGVVVVGIRRGEHLISAGLAEVELEDGDGILALGELRRLEELTQKPDFEASSIGIAALEELSAHLYLMRIPESSLLIGSTIEESRFGELVGVTVGGIVREGMTFLAVSPQERIRADDLLLVAGEPSRVIHLLEMGEVKLESKISEPVLESEEVGVAEASVAPRSRAAGKTLRDLSFREKYGLQVLGIWRAGELVRTGLANLSLRFGDALLLQGPLASMRRMAADRDFVVLSETGRVPPRTEKMPFALIGLLLMIGLVLSGWQPIQVAAFASATLVVLSGAITMEEAYRAIEWRAVFLVAAVLPVGFAMEKTGAALLLAENVVEFAGPWGPYVVLAAVVMLSSLLSQGLDGAPAVVLLAPVVFETAEQLGLSPYPIMMGVALAASAAFMTPFSHKANLLVMGAGGYRSMDYVKVGTPLTIILLLLMVFLIPLFFPF